MPSPILLSCVDVPIPVRFERRDIILVAGVALLALGLAPFIAPIYAMAVAAAVFLGIKAYAARRQSTMLKLAGLGFCAQCGSAVTEHGCPQCDRLDNTP